MTNEMMVCASAYKQTTELSNAISAANFSLCQIANELVASFAKYKVGDIIHDQQQPTGLLVDGVSASVEHCDTFNEYRLWITYSGWRTRLTKRTSIRGIKNQRVVVNESGVHYAEPW